MIKFEFETSADYKPDVKHKIWINNSIRNEGKIPGEISYLFCDDDYMIGQNIHFLNHDTFTDIITFSENVGKVINGSILVSLDRIKENSNLFGVSFEKTFWVKFSCPIETNTSSFWEIVLCSKMSSS